MLPGFDPSLFVSALAAHRPTFLHVVPPLLSFLAHSPLVTPEHLASLRQVELGLYPLDCSSSNLQVNTGAAPCGPTLLAQLYEKAPSYTIIKEGWGMTEVSGGVTGISRAYGGIKPGSCNQMVSNVRLQVGLFTDHIVRQPM